MLTVDGETVKGTELANNFNSHPDDSENGGINSNACGDICKTYNPILLRSACDNVVYNVVSRLNSSSPCDEENVRLCPEKYVLDIPAPYWAQFLICLLHEIFPNRNRKEKVSAL